MGRVERRRRTFANPAELASVPAMRNAERARLAEDAARTRYWKRWGPYLSERQWATVREDYSPGGDCWNYFPHDHARSRAYRWGEDGLLGITDSKGRLAFALALWNGRDPILKERLFGLTGPEGTHGEDVKECYYYLDATPTHSYLKSLYKYPHSEFPYARLAEEARRRGSGSPEFELADSGVFDGGRYFDVFAEYAKASPEDIAIRITVANRGPEAARIDVLPTLWFRNNWAWGRESEGHTKDRPRIRGVDGGTLRAEHEELGPFLLRAEPVRGKAEPVLLFTENATNARRLFGAPSPTPCVKDAFPVVVGGGRGAAVTPEREGTKAAFLYRLEVPGGESAVLRLRLTSEREAPARPFGSDLEKIFGDRQREADEFFDSVLPKAEAEEERRVARQAYAGLLHSKQFYHYVVNEWLEGDPTQPAPPADRREGRNADWTHLYNRDVISMPDKWEYPWFAAWDLAFHMLPFARIDPAFAKDQLLLFLREWYMHPNGQIPAYEFAFGDVNPPVHAWAVWRVYKIAGPKGGRDRAFLRRAFDKLVMNFTWWVNRKDPEGRHLFSGGFLGLDNIGVFDRSRPLPTGGRLEQADGTAWMAFYCATMLAISLELAEEDPVYEDMASKFFEHFVAIADAMNNLGGTGLWDEGDGFYYDQLHTNGERRPLKVRSLVGLIPLLVAEVLDEQRIGRLPGFKKRMEWFLRYRPDLARHITYMCCGPAGDMRFLAIPSEERLRRVLRTLLHEEEFLSPYGIRSISRVHARAPFVFRSGGEEWRVEYAPGESTTGLFGGNSNWRGPIWFPINYLLVEALERYHRFYGDALQVECPTGSGRTMNLQQVAHEIARRLSSIFLPGEGGGRPVHAGDPRYASDPHWRDLCLFYEYFHGDTGRGLGASHQTGWTALVARLLEDLARARTDRVHAGA